MKAQTDPVTGRDTGRPVGLVAGGLLWIATLALPRGVSRNRYRQEFAAELYGKPKLRQIVYALRVSEHIWSLRSVLVHGEDAVHVPFLCRTNLHHHWVGHRSEEGVRFQTCSRCEREEDRTPTFWPLMPPAPKPGHRTASRGRPRLGGRDDHAF